MLYLIFLTGQSTPLATAASEDDAAFIVRALNAYDLQIGGEFCASYAPANDPEHRTVDIDDRIEAAQAPAQ